MNADSDSPPASHRRLSSPVADWAMDKLRLDFPDWSITVDGDEFVAVRGRARLTAGSAAVLGARLAHAAFPVPPHAELGALIRDYRDRWEIQQRAGGRFVAYRRPRRRVPVAVNASTARELRQLLGPPDGIQPASSEQRVEVIVSLKGDEATSFMAAEPGDPEQWELANVSTGETFSPHGMDRAHGADRTYDMGGAQGMGGAHDLDGADGMDGAQEDAPCAPDGA